MAYNNPALFDAVLSGASGGSFGRWITAERASDYDTAVDAVEAFATAVDAAIPTIAVVSLSDTALLQAIVQGIITSRSLASLSFDYADIASAITAVFDEARTRLNSAALTSDQVANVSAVLGATVTLALDALAGTVAVLDTDDIANVSGVAGSDASDALDTLASRITSLNTDQINNVSGVVGSVCSDALDSLAATAATAQTTANTAVTNAATAQTTANTAVTNAATAQTTANTAVTNAATAQATANTAVTNAATAQATANAICNFNWGVVQAASITAARFFIRTSAALNSGISAGEYVCGAAGSRVVTITWSVSSALVVDNVILVVMINSAASTVTSTMLPGVISGQASATIVLAGNDRFAVRATQSSTEVNATWNCAVSVQVR